MKFWGIKRIWRQGRTTVQVGWGALVLLFGAAYGVTWLVWQVAA